MNCLELNIKVVEPVSERDMVAVVGGYVYQHNQTDLEFLRVRKEYCSLPRLGVVADRGSVVAGG